MKRLNNEFGDFDIDYYSKKMNEDAEKVLFSSELK